MMDREMKNLFQYIYELSLIDLKMENLKNSLLNHLKLKNHLIFYLYNEFSFVKK